jgi:hypothetical protein
MEAVLQVENGLGEDRILYTIDLISPPVAPTIRHLSTVYIHTCSAYTLKRDRVQVISD